MDTDMHMEEADARISPGRDPVPAKERDSLLILLAFLNLREADRGPGLRPLPLLTDPATAAGAWGPAVCGAVISTKSVEIAFNCSFGFRARSQPFR